MWRFFDLYILQVISVFALANAGIVSINNIQPQRLYLIPNSQNPYNFNRIVGTNGLSSHVIHPGNNLYTHDALHDTSRLILPRREGFVNEINFSSRLAKPVISKEFYIHSAPDDIEEPIHKVINLGQSEKKYRVVFIKPPVNTRPKTRLSLINQQNEEQTVIYVLAKKRDENDIETDVHSPPTGSNKPEVVFVKYKTNEEAAEAQRRIQAEYDALGGTNRISNEGVAPLTSVVGSISDIGPINYNTLLESMDTDYIHKTNHLEQDFFENLRKDHGIKYLPVK